MFHLSLWTRWKVMTIQVQVRFFFFPVVELVEVEDFFLLETILLKQLLGNNARNNGSNDLHRFLDASHHCETIRGRSNHFFLQLGFQHLIAPGCSSKETKLNFCLSCIPAFETNKHQIQTKISQIKHNILYI